MSNTALQRLPVCLPGESDLRWYFGLLGENLLAVAIEGSLDRERVRGVVQLLCDALAQPVSVGDVTFQLRTAAGVSLLRQDAVELQALIEHVRAAMSEARRGGTIQFYSDTLRMLPVARLDIERELRRAVAEDQIALRYRPRHDLKSGELVAVQAYMRWLHPLRGEIAPAEFLPIADATGLAIAVSRAALARLAADSDALRERFGASINFSFGALRQHVTSGQLARDCRELIGSKALATGQLELRIAERTLAGIGRTNRIWGEFKELGAALVIDELGRGFSSLSRLSRLPVTVLQIDRALVLGALEQDIALRACRAVAALARAYDVTAVAPGIDSEEHRTRMLAIGCTQGLGDLFGALPALRAPAGRI